MAPYANPQRATFAAGSVQVDPPSSRLQPAITAQLAATPMFREVKLEGNLAKKTKAAIEATERKENMVKEEESEVFESRHTNAVKIARTPPARRVRFMSRCDVMNGGFAFWESHDVALPMRGRDVQMESPMERYPRKRRSGPDEEDMPRKSVEMARRSNERRMV